MKKFILLILFPVIISGCTLIPKKSSQQNNDGGINTSVNNSKVKTSDSNTNNIIKEDVKNDSGINTSVNNSEVKTSDSNTNNIINEDVKVAYVTYTDKIFSYSISRPKEWTVYEKDFSSGYLLMPEVQFWPRGLAVGNEHIRVGVTRMLNFTDETKKSYLEAQDSWRSYTLDGLPAYITPDGAQVMVFRPSAIEGGMDIYYLLYDYSLKGSYTSEYMNIFSEMVSSFKFSK